MYSSRVQYVAVRKRAGETRFRKQCSRERRTGKRAEGGQKEKGRGRRRGREKKKEREFCNSFISQRGREENLPG
jgi:hypothetical protein